MRWLVICFLLVLCGGSALMAEDEPRYEMDHYVIGFLKKGPKWTAESTPETQKIQAGHMANIQRMGQTRKLIVAGPMEDNGELRGILIFHTTMEDAKREAERDPAVQAGRLTLELHPWFAAKGLSVAPPVAPKR